MEKLFSPPHKTPILAESYEEFRERIKMLPREERIAELTKRDIAFSEACYQRKQEEWRARLAAASVLSGSA